MLHIVEMLPKIIHGQIFSNLFLDQSTTVRHQEWAMAPASAKYYFILKQGFSKTANKLYDLRR